MPPPPLESLSRLSSALPVPVDYFQGLRAPHPVRADNILLFHRDSFSALQQRSLENRSHHRFVLFVALSGGAGVNLDQAEHPLRPGWALLAFPYQFHFFLHPERERLAWLILTFESETPEALAPLRDRPVQVDVTSADRLRLLLTSYAAARSGVESQVRLLAESFLQALVDAARAKQPSPASESATAPAPEATRWLTHINARLHAGVPGGFKITACAAELGVSERLLRLRFSQNFGVSLGVYVHNFQLNRAAGLITQSGLPLGEIARSCGYVSQSAFSRAFRDRYGLAPKDYRQARRAPDA